MPRLSPAKTRKPRSKANVAQRYQAKGLLRSKLVASLGLTLMVASLALVLAAELGSVGDTVAYFQDPEVTVDNKLQAGQLAFAISPHDDDEGYFKGNSGVGTEEYYVTTQQTEASLPVVYAVTGSLAEDNPAGCEALTLTAQFGDFAYSGLFINFVSSPITNMGEWDFDVALPLFSDVLAPGAWCKGQFIFKAGLDGVDPTLADTFSDQKTYTFEIQNWNEDLNLGAVPFASTPSALITEPEFDPEPEPEVLGENIETEEEENIEPTETQSEGNPEPPNEPEPPVVEDEPIIPPTEPEPPVESEAVPEPPVETPVE